MNRRMIRRQQGAAITELAIMSVLVLVPALWFSIVFYDLSVTKIKLQEAARFAAFEFTIREVSDWLNADHAGRFRDTLMPDIKDRVRERYGDDLDSATPRYANSAAHALLGFDVQFQDSDFKIESKDPQIFSIAGVDWGNKAADVVLGDLMKFNTAGMIYADVSVTLNNRLVPINSFADQIGLPMLSSDKFALMPARVVLLADAWDIKDGSTIYEDQADTTGYGKQVGRCAFLGIFNESGALGKAMGAFGDVLKYVDIDLPTRAERLMTAPYVNRDRDSGKTPPLAVAPDSRCSDCYPDDEGTTPGKRFHTAPLRVENPYNGEYFVTFNNRLGAYYMGCPVAQQQEGSCTYQ